MTTQGSVEDWTVENRTLENHEFHLHQTHFLVLSQDNFALNGTEHEDAGMMAIIRVLPYPGEVTPNRAASISE